MKLRIVIALWISDLNGRRSASYFAVLRFKFCSRVILSERKSMDLPAEDVDFTACFLCNEQYQDPRILSCIHTFCMKCLLKLQSSPDYFNRPTFPCPRCSCDVQTPEDGVEAMPQNRFIEKLTELKRMLKPELTERVCSACVEQKSDEMSSVENYCFDCSEMLCNECTKQHNKSKASKYHEILSLTEATENMPKLMESLGQSCCKEHIGSALDLYCTDCHVEVCAKCFIGSHQQHRWTELKTCAEGFRNELGDLVWKIESCEDDIKNRKLQLDSEKLDLINEAKSILDEIEAARQETQQTLDKHTDLLISDISSQETAKSNAIEEFCGKFDTKLNLLSDFKTYCKELFQNGSSSDVCTFINDIKTRSEELYHMSELTVTQSQTSFRIDLRLERNKHQEDFNFVGRLQDKNSVDGDSESNEACIKRLTEEINQLTQELQKERTLRLSREEQLEAYIQHAETLTSQLKEEQAKTIYQVEKIEDLKTTSQRENREWSAKETQWKKECNEMKMTNNDLKNRVETEKAKVAELQRTVETVNSCNKEHEERKTTLMEDHEKETIELIGKINAMQTDMDFLITLVSGNVSRKPKGSIDYTSLNGASNRLKHVVIRPVDHTAEGHVVINGLAILGNELYIAGRNNSIVEVRNLETMEFIRRWRLQDMKDPIDMVSCSVTNCLYLVANMKSGIYLIARVNIRGALLKSWSIGDKFGNLSSTEEGNVLLTVAKDSVIEEYSKDGILLRTIELSWNFGFKNLHHAVKLSTNHFLVSHGSGEDGLHRVCIVDGAGEVLKSYGREWNRADLNCPVHVIRDSGGNILVADELNGCIHAFESNLQLIIATMAKNSSARDLQEIKSVTYTFRPRKICLDESRSRLFVVEAVNEKRPFFLCSSFERLSVFALRCTV